MKTFFVLCAVLSVAFANVMPELMDLEFDDLELFEDEKGEDKGLPVTEEQMQCVKDGIEKLSNSYPNLNEWFTECEKSAYEMLDRAIDCYSKSGLKKTWCMTKLKVSALSFYRTYKKKLPKEHQGVIGEIKDVAEECLKIKIPIS